MIRVVDYGLGNVQAFVNIYKRLGIPVDTAKNSQELMAASKVILPGVGAFDWAMTRLENSGMRQALDFLAIEKKTPVLGVCVGMQMMARHSEEGSLKGLGWMNGEIKRMVQPSSAGPMILPHMGWNEVNARSQDLLFAGMQGTPRFYFLHSYQFMANLEDSVIAETCYGGKFASAVRAENLFGVQFHPEKSHGWGIQLLKNFAECA